MLPTEEHPNEPVKVADSTHQNDCPSIREEEIAISPDGKNIQPEEDTLVSVFDRITNVIAVGLLVLVAIASIVSIVAGACMLASLSGKEFRTFPLFFASGVAPIVTGAVCLALVTFVIFFIAFCAMGIGRYGMCCYGSTKARGAMRMCLLGVFPFIVFIFLVVMGLWGFSFYSLSQQLPPLDKNYVNVPGISGPIEIVRDVNGLTHIRASNRRDAYLGQGFAEAQDRLFPLEFQRTVAQGKFAKLVGEDGVAADKIIRTLNVRDAAISMCKSTDPVHVDMFQAFADGVNLYLERVKQRPVEFFFIGSKPLTFHNPEAFSALDMCLSSRLFIWQMGSNVAFEGQRLSVWAETGRSYNEVEELYWNFTEAPNTILSQERLVSFLLAADSSLTPDTIPALLEESTKQQASSRETEAAIYDNLLSTIRSQLKEGPAASKPAKAHRTLQNEVAHVMQKNFYQPEDDTLFTYKFIDASNGWASRQADGKTMVASDPHLTVNLPPVWYYVHLSFPDEDGVQYDAAGVGLTGLPGVHVGKTTTRAHAITMSKTDLQDLFIFPPALFSGLPEGTYRYAGENHKFVRRQERIEVKGKNDIVLTAQDTILGPIVTDALGFPKELMVALYDVALRHGDDTSIPALLSISDPKVDTAEKLMGSLLGLQGPGFSIPIGDIHGNLAYAVTGRHPLRAHGHTGKYPTPAFDAAAVLAAMESATSKGEDFTATIPKIQQLIQTSNWSTYPASNNVQDSRIPPSMNPHIHIPYDTSNPTAAHISAANQKITPLGYPHLLGEDFSWPWRGARAQQMLDEKLGTLDRLETHRSIQMDHRSNIWALDMRPVVNAASFQGVIADDPKAVAWAKRLLDWDMDAPIGSVEAAFFWRWMQRMAVLPRDAIKASGTKSSLWGPEHGYSVRMLTAPTARMLAECADYMGVPNSADACLQFAARTFKEQSAPGQSYNEKWGQDLNRLRGVHFMLEKKSIIPVFRRTMNKAGDFTSLDVSGHSIAGSMESTQAPSMRLLYDLWDDVDHVHFCLPGGNSGNPYSPYYQNMWDKFARQEYTTVVATTKAWGSIDRAHTQSLRK